MISYVARVRFVTGAGNTWSWMWIHIMAFFFTALLVSLWGFLRKYAQPRLTCFSFKNNTTVEQISRAFSHGCITPTCRNVPLLQDFQYRAAHENVHGGKVYMTWPCSLQRLTCKPSHHLVQSSQNSLPSICFSNTIFSNYNQHQVFKDSFTSFSNVCAGVGGGCGRVSNLLLSKIPEEAEGEVKRVASASFESQYGWDNLRALKLGVRWRSIYSHQLGLNLSNFTNRDLRRIQSLAKDIEKCTDIVWNNTIRVWDIEAGKCLRYNKLNDTMSTVLPSRRVQKSPPVFLLSGNIVTREEKCLLYVWDFRMPHSFSLGSEMTLIHSVEFIDKVVYIWDDLNEKVFDLRKSGVVECRKRCTSSLL